MVATNIVELSLLDERPNVRLLKVLDLVLVGGGKVSAHAAVVAGDDDTALASGLDIVDAVLSVYTGLGAGVLEGISILVLADASDVKSRVLGKDVLEVNISVISSESVTGEWWGKNYLSTTSSVLSSTTSNQFGIVFEQLLIEAHVLVLSQDSIIGFETILLQESVITTLVSTALINQLSSFEHTQQLECLKAEIPQRQ